MVGKTSSYRNCDRPTFEIYKALHPDSMNNDTVSDRPVAKPYVRVVLHPEESRIK